jgi:hypothetical protein
MAQRAAVSQTRAAEMRQEEAPWAAPFETLPREASEEPAPDGRARMRPVRPAPEAAAWRETLALRQEQAAPHAEHRRPERV